MASSPNFTLSNGNQIFSNTSFPAHFCSHSTAEIFSYFFQSKIFPSKIIEIINLNFENKLNFSKNNKSFSLLKSYNITQPQKNKIISYLNKIQEYEKYKHICTQIIDYLQS